MLRPALEVAWAVARAGEDATPAVDAPRALRPFLRFSRLPDKALAATRRVVDEDEEFRARVSPVVSEAEVGRAGFLFVARPQGWQEELEGLLAAAAREVSAAREDHDERTARRRLRGAEQAARRAEEALAAVRAEVTRLGTELATERRARRTAEEELSRTTKAVRRVTEDAGRAQADTERLSAELDTANAELAGVRGALEQARAQLTARGRATGDEPGASPATGGPTPGASPAASGPVGASSVTGSPASGVTAVALPATGSPASAAPGAGPQGPSPAGASSAPSGGPRTGPDAPGGQPAVDVAALRSAVATAAEAAATLGSALAAAAAAISPPTGPPAPAGAGGTEAEAEAGPSHPQEGRGAAQGGGREATATGANRPVGPARAGRAGAPPARARRVPAALPPATFADSVEAADHLVRLPGVVVLVDGYNVAMLRWPEQAVAEQRRRLVDALGELAARTGAEVQVVFDGAEQVEPPAVPGPRRPVRVSFSPPGTEADDVIIERTADLPVHRPVVVVSSDQRVQRGAAANGANVISSPQLLAVMGR